MGGAPTIYHISWYDGTMVGAPFVVLFHLPSSLLRRFTALAPAVGGGHRVYAWVALGWHFAAAKGASLPAFPAATAPPGQRYLWLALALPRRRSPLFTTRPPTTRLVRVGHMGAGAPALC